MTVQTTDTVVGPFNGNDVATAFPWTNVKVLSTADLLVIHTDSVGVETTLTEGVDYSVVLNSDQETSPGGTITYPISGSPLATGDKLTGKRVTSQIQDTDLANQGKYDAEVVEDSFDQAMMVIQEHTEELSRTVKVDVSSSTTPDDLLNSIVLSESNSAASASAASVSETNAAAEVVNAATEVGYSAEWATKPEDSLISVAAGGDGATDYSSLHWAAKASGVVAPPDIAGFVKGQTIYVEENQGSHATPFDFSTAIGNAFESIGPTGSGATNIWTALDGLPASVKFVRVKLVNVLGTDVIGDFLSSIIYARKTGSGGTPSVNRKVSQLSFHNLEGGGDNDSNITYVDIPVDVNNSFDLYNNLYNPGSATLIVREQDLYLVGFAT